MANKTKLRDTLDVDGLVALEDVNKTFFVDGPSSELLYSNGGQPWRPNVFKLNPLRIVFWRQRAVLLLLMAVDAPE